MGNVLLERANPPMWAIDEGPHGRAPSVRFGDNSVALDDIIGLSLAEKRDRPVIGLLLASALFMIVGVTFAFLVFEAGAMQRLLVGAVFLIFLAVAGLTETLTIKSQSIFALTITRIDGDDVVFTSPDRADVAALALRLAAAEGLRHQRR
ncbi:MAG: hypothetical protein ACRCS9_04785 [Hyphomicrobium sp.]